MSTIGEQLEFVRQGASDLSCIGLHLHNIHPNPLEDVMVGPTNICVRFDGIILGGIKGVHILHNELPGPHEPKPGADFIPILPPWMNPNGIIIFL